MAFRVELAEAAVFYGIGDLADGGVARMTGNWVLLDSNPQVGIATSQSSYGYWYDFKFEMQGAVVTLTDALLFSPGDAILLRYTGRMEVDLATVVDGLDDAVLLSGDDTIVGNSAANRLQGHAGNDTMEGGAGLDTAVFAGDHTAYLVSQLDGGLDVVGPDGHDVLHGIERLEFDDGNVAFDIDGTAGKAYRLYQAAFDRAPDLGGLGYQIHDLDTRFTLSQVAGNFIASPEFQAKYGNVDDSQFIALLYRNVLDREPDAGGLQWHLDELAHGYSRADVLTFFSESPENQANVIGAIANGIFYTGYGG